MQQRLQDIILGKNFGRGVKSNPNAIFIMCPIFHKVRKQSNNTEEINKEDNEEYTNIIYYKWKIVYDIKDTYIIDEKKAEAIRDNLMLNNNTSADLHEILLKISPIKIENKPIYTGAYGYYSKKENKIVIDERLSMDDKTATLLHEMSHAMYDDFEYSKEKNFSEIFVESIAFIVADYFGLDTGKTSFIYVTNWSGEDAKKVLKFGEKIQKASDDFIKKIEDEMYKEKNERIS